MKATWILCVAMMASLSPRSTTCLAQQPDSLAKVFSAIQSGQIKVVDLSYALDDQSPYWPEGDAPSPFHARTAATYDHDGYFARTLEMPEHS